MGQGVASITKASVYALLIDYPAVMTMGIEINILSHFGAPAHAVTGVLHQRLKRGFGVRGSRGDREWIDNILEMGNIMRLPANLLETRRFYFFPVHRPFPFPSGEVGVCQYKG